MGKQVKFFLVLLGLLVLAAVAGPARADIDPNTVQKLIADDGTVADRFGASVAVDGDTAIIGVYLDDDKGAESGSAYVYIRSGGSWALQQKLCPDDLSTQD